MASRKNIESSISLANSKISIYSVCSLVGVEIPEGREGSSIKTYCPFGIFYHSDGGKEPAFRAYPESNTAYCFSCKKYFTPVSLYSACTDLSKKASAETLLEMIGYKKPSPEEVWNNVQPREPDVDKSMLGMALKTYCERICSSWSKRQLDGIVADRLDSCLSLLSKVSSSEEAEYWLRASKEVMLRTIGDDDDVPRV